MLFRIEEASLELSILSGSSSAGLRVCAFSHCSCPGALPGPGVWLSQSRNGAAVVKVLLLEVEMCFWIFSPFFIIFVTLGAVLCVAEGFPPLLHLTKTFGVICWQY